jgi:hypothetical protein
MQSIPVLRNTVKLSTFDIEHLPNHKTKSAKEWSSSCPTCGGKDRFLFWPNEGNFWCRQCELAGFVDQEAQSTLTEDQLADIEYRKRQARQAEIDRKRTALQQLQAKRNDLAYHRNLNGNSGYVQRKWGVTEDTIDIFKVGYCNACPTSPYSDSITIPYYWGDSLINLRHRLSSPNGQGKYRPEAAGLPTAIFNANIIENEDWLVLVEGEFKVMVLQQNGLPAIGIPGATNFKEKWLKLFSPKQMIYVALDPGVESAAIKIVKMFSSAGLQARLVSIPTKPDDFYTLYTVAIMTNSVNT